MDPQQMSLLLQNYRLQHRGSGGGAAGLGQGGGDVMWPSHKGQQAGHETAAQRAGLADMSLQRRASRGFLEEAYGVADVPPEILAGVLEVQSSAKVFSKLLSCAGRDLVLVTVLCTLRKLGGCRKSMTSFNLWAQLKTRIPLLVCGTWRASPKAVIDMFR